MTSEPVQAPAAHPKSRASRRGLLTFFLVLALVVALMVIAGILPRLSREKALLSAAETQRDQRPVVEVAAARQAPARSTLDLPGDMQPIVDAPIFARVDGYLSKRLVDYGDRVHTGQLLAEIETPELDQQIGQAHATLSQSQATLKELDAALALAKANLNLSAITQKRYDHLTKAGVFSRQDNDEKQADLEVKQAELARADAAIHTAQETVHANDANLHRLESMKAFARVVAPYDGVITTRNVDVGTLINAGNNGREMFHIAQINPLRIFVNVPQTYVADIRPGQTAELRVQELPGQVFSAKVTRIANALDANSRAMLTVLEVANPRGTLMPGMYTQVDFSVPRADPPLSIPSDTLVMRSTGPQVAVVRPDGSVHFTAIQLGRDFGDHLEVLAGIEEGQQLVVNPSDMIREGVKVKPLPAEKPAGGRS